MYTTSTFQLLVRGTQITCIGCRSLSFSSSGDSSLFFVAAAALLAPPPTGKLIVFIFSLLGDLVLTLCRCFRLRLEGGVELGVVVGVASGVVLTLDSMLSSLQTMADCISSEYFGWLTVDKLLSFNHTIADIYVPPHNNDKYNTTINSYNVIQLLLSDV